MKRAQLLLLVVVSLAASIALAQEASEFPSIKNFFRMDKQFCAGGQPAMEDLARLKAEGVRAIVNLRRAEEYNAAEEESKAKELGLRYFSIPVAADALKDEQVEEFLKITADPQNRPAFVHCRTGGRVATFWMIRRALVDGWKVEDAEAEARKMGLQWQIGIDFARGYIERHAKKDAK